MQGWRDASLAAAALVLVWLHQDGGCGILGGTGCLCSRHDPCIQINACSLIVCSVSASVCAQLAPACLHRHGVYGVYTHKPRRVYQTRGDLGIGRFGDMTGHGLHHYSCVERFEKERQADGMQACWIRELAAGTSEALEEMVTYRLRHVGIEGQQHVAQLPCHLLVNTNTRRHLRGSRACR